MAMLAAGCAPGPVPIDPEPPRFARARRAWAPEELDRDIVACARAGREAALARDDLLTAHVTVLIRAQREATIACMAERRWVAR